MYFGTFVTFGRRSDQNHRNTFSSLGSLLEEVLSWDKPSGSYELLERAANLLPKLGVVPLLYFTLPDNCSRSALFLLASGQPDALEYEE